MERRHSDVLIAGLILVGATMWLGGIVSQLTVLGHYERLAIWFPAGFAAAQIARRLLVDLDFGETAIAAIVSIAIVIGIRAHRNGDAMDVDMLIPIGVTELGAIAGALTSRRRSAETSPIWLVLAAGFGGFGAAVLAVGLTMLAFDSRGSIGLALLAGSVIGCFIIALFTNVRGRQCALGQAIAFGALFATTTKDGPVSGALIGLGLGAVLGAIGGGIGGRVNAARQPKPTLPEAHVQ